jgi:hypothetical protein
VLKMKVTTRKGRDYRTKVTSEVEALKQFLTGFILDGSDTLRNELRPVDIVQALLPNREIIGEEYLNSISAQHDEELQAAIQLAKIWQDLRQASRKFYQFKGRNSSMVARFKTLLNIAPKSHK